MPFERVPQVPEKDHKVFATACHEMRVRRRTIEGVQAEQSRMNVCHVKIWSVYDLYHYQISRLV